ETLHALEHRLSDAEIDYVIIGGMALAAHDYTRQTVEVDVVLIAAGFERFKSRYVGSAYRRAGRLPRRFVDATSDVGVDVLISGQLAGNKQRNKTIRFPDPVDAETHRDLRTVSLARLIELKLVTWRFKDWGDVVELIRANALTEAFSEQLDPTVASAYRQCLDQAHDPEYEGP
ncbi:MAG: hypothetical protein IID40_10240, partial [Planctomycetes bacterium]|nr:hypothetical protein [Planctomycetota bacterium]